MSTFVSKGRVSGWTFPEKLRDGFFKRGDANGIPYLEKAYAEGEHDDILSVVESEAESATLTDALRHWDKRVLSTLRRRTVDLPH